MQDNGVGENNWTYNRNNWALDQTVIVKLEGFISLLTCFFTYKQELI